VQDVFELQVGITLDLVHTASRAGANHVSSQRNLNNAFAYDLVPSPSVLTAALKAARRVNDFPTAVRIFEGMSPFSPIPRSPLLSPPPTSANPS
jgi:Cytochrome c oxidase subunit Va